MVYQLKKLEYDYDSLEPYIDEQTMKVHHDKHHQAYVDKYNAAIEKFPELQKKTPEKVIENLDKIHEDIKIIVKNNGGGVVNHNFFWTILKKDVEIEGDILDAINKEFESFIEFKKKFSEIALSVFGSGWAWLIIDKKTKKLQIIKTLNQDSPLSIEKIPLLCIDIWEHAYYLKYQNRRAEYIENFFNVINWEKVNENYISVNSAKVKGGKTFKK
ncbi:MAG: superoxide dismutase [Nanoarchaeota archaeon]